MFCVKCGAEVNEGQDTCPKCGVRLEKPEASDKPGAPTARPSRRAIVIGVAAVAVFSLYFVVLAFLACYLGPSRIGLARVAFFLTA